MASSSAIAGAVHGGQTDRSSGVSRSPGPGARASAVPGWYQTNRGVEPSARTAVPAWLSSVMFSFVQAGPRPATTVAGWARWRRAAPGPRRGGVGVGLVGRAVVRRAARSTSGPPRCPRSARSGRPTPRPRRSGGPPRSRSRRRGRCRRRRRPRPATRAAPAARCRRRRAPAGRPTGPSRRAGRWPPGRGWWGRRRTPWCRHPAARPRVRRSSAPPRPRRPAGAAPRPAPGRRPARCPRGRGRRWAAAPTGRAAPRAAAPGRPRRRRRRCAAPGSGPSDGRPLGGAGVSSVALIVGLPRWPGRAARGRVRARSASSAMTSRADSGRAVRRP